MITFPMIPGIEINIFLLVFLGLAVGIVSGFVGVGGGFLMTPALIILGFPANFAVGTSLAWIVGNSIVGTLRHRQLGNVDMKLGVLMIAGTVCGVEIGVRLLDWTRNMGLADEAVLAVSISILLIIGVYTFWEACRRKAELDDILRRKEKLPPDMRAASISAKLQQINIPPMIHFTKSRITISLWLILAVGLGIGILAGFIGVGGGFIMVPSLVYLIGLPSFMAVGTSMFQIVIPAAWGCVRHTMSGNVVIFAAFIMVVASCIGVQFGVLVTRYVRGVSMRYILGISILVCAIGAMLKLSGILLEKGAIWLETSSVAVTFGGMGLTVIMILALFIVALRYHRGQHIPTWIESLVAKED
jgi:hypothetical protein